MQTQEYITLTAALGFTRAGTATALGVSIRQEAYYRAGRPIPETVAKLLRLLVLHDPRNIHGKAAPTTPPIFPSAASDR